ncbi:MAG: type IV pilus assembly protein PilE [Bacteroidetes bacterium]|nr:MAG: type IV pilus assembly protein PilE [Bacteroidota bacterium]
MQGFPKNRLPGFTLTELLVVLAIIGILVLIALPSLMPLISKAKSTEAQQNLSLIHSLERAYRFEHFKYSNDFKAIGYEANKTVKNGGSADYSYEVTESGNTTFKVRATAETDFDGDGVMNIWEIDQDKNLKEVQPD